MALRKKKKSEAIPRPHVKNNRILGSAGVETASGCTLLYHICQLAHLTFRIDKAFLVYRLCRHTAKWFIRDLSAGRQAHDF